MKKLHQNSFGGAKYKLVSLLLKKRVLHTIFPIEYQRDIQEFSAVENSVENLVENTKTY